jgi:hypothetical protein
MACHAGSGWWELPGSAWGGWVPEFMMKVYVVFARASLGIDMNADHLAAWRLDPCGNPVGAPRRFAYDLSGSMDHPRRSGPAHDHTADALGGALRISGPLTRCASPDRDLKAGTSVLKAVRSMPLSKALGDRSRCRSASRNGNFQWAEEDRRTDR